MEGTKFPSLRYTGDLVPHLVDKRAASTPNAVYAEYPVSALTYNEGYRKITYREFANAVNGMAKWLVETLGPGKEFETLAYIGPNDIRYPALILGAVKAGYKLFLTSPRNSAVAQFNLFGRLDCKTLLSPEPRPPAVTAITEYQPIYVVQVPDVSFFLDNQHQHFTFHKSWPEAQLEPLFVVHTSGSTGMPKPLIYTHATAAANIKMLSLDPPDGYESQDRVYRGRSVFVAFPPFHGAYLVLHLFSAVPFGTVVVSPISGALLSGEGLVASLRQTPADVALIVPSIAQDLAQSPELLNYCSKHLKAIIYCGGDLPQAIGDTIASRIRLLNQFGASELGLTPHVLSLTDRGPEDWKYAQFHSQLGLELRHVADGIHELYAVRDPEKIETQPTFTIFPNAQEYATRDLFVCHSSRDKPDIWRWQARADDIIVFLNGEKTNPISMEQHIVARHPDISAALVVGAQRFQAALLIEPITGGQALDATERAALIERVWPTVEEANEDAPFHARLTKSHILFTQPQKPMLRAGKGTVQRSGTLKAYASEIDALYKDADTMLANLEGETVEPSGTMDEGTVAKCVRQSVLSTVKWSELDETANFFSLGMDSLQALVLVRRLRRSLGLPMIALSTLYTNPSITALAAAILRLSDQDQNSKASQQEAQAKQRNNVIQGYKQLIDKRLLPKSNAELNIIPKQAQETVILTGSTGTLGSYVLDVLLQSESVAHIYCLNRATDSLSVQVKKSRLLGLLDPSSNKRTSFVTVDLSQLYFNLERAEYNQLMSETTLIIHNAWMVNFNLPLASFIPQLDNLVHLLDFATNCAHQARFLFMSSISSVMSYRSVSGKTPEETIAVETAPGPNGYAESKYIAEQIIDHAAQRVSLGPSLAFARVGQIAGATKHSGIWNKAEWFPSMIMSSAHVGALPDSLGPVFSMIDWVPIDLLACILVELALTRSDSAANSLASQNHHTNVYHPLNPHPTTWVTLKPIILDELSSRTESPIEVVPLRVWIGKVREKGESMVDRGEDTGDVDLELALQKNPATKLLDFYERLAASETASTNQLEYSKTLKLSQAMRQLKPIKDEWVRKWIREWFAP